MVVVGVAKESKKEERAGRWVGARERGLWEKRGVSSKPVACFLNNVYPPHSAININPSQPAGTSLIRPPLFQTFYSLPFDMPSKSPLFCFFGQIILVTQISLFSIPHYLHPLFSFSPPEILCKNCGSNILINMSIPPILTRFTLHWTIIFGWTI